MAKNDSNISNMKPTLFTITLRAVASAAILSLTASATTGNAQSVVPLIVIDNVPLPDAIRNLARQFDLNYILDPRVPGSDFGPGRAVLIMGFCNSVVGVMVFSLVKRAVFDREIWVDG